MQGRPTLIGRLSALLRFFLSFSIRRNTWRIYLTLLMEGL